MSKSIRRYLPLILLLIAVLGALPSSVFAQPAPAQPNAPAAQVSCISPPPDLVSWWPGNGDATDVTGSSDGTLQDGATFGDGTVGQGFSFSGGTQRVFIPDSPSLTITGSLTLDAWVRLTAYPAGVGLIIFRGDDRSALDPYTLIVVGTNVRIQIEDGTGGFEFVEAPIGLNEFVHVAGTLDDATGTLTLYLNGSVASQKTTAIRPFGALTGANPGASIGNVQSDIVAEGFIGQIDEVGVFNRALSALEIESIVEAGSAGMCTSASQTATKSLLPEIVRAVPDPLDISTEPDVVATNAGLALVGVVIVFLSAQVFNSTLKENEQGIESFGRSYVRPLLWPFRAARDVWRRILANNPRYSRIATTSAILIATALIYGYLEPGFSLDEKSGILFVISLAIGLGVVTYVYGGTESRVTERLSGVQADVRIYPAALAIAVVCVLITRATSFQPGVLYGFVAASAVLGPRKPEPRQEGQALVIAATALISVFISAWFLMIPFRDWVDSDENLISATLETSSTIVAVAALETLALSMVPLEFQDGAKVWKYSRVAWALLAFIAAFLYWHVVLVQEDASFKALGAEGTLAALAVLGVCVGLTATFWGFFYLRRRAQGRHTG